MAQGTLATSFIILLFVIVLVGMFAQADVNKHEFWTRIPNWAIILGVIAAVAIFVIPIFATFQY